MSARNRQARVLASRATWNIADQVVSSGTNLVLSLIVARALTADGFGAFAVAFTIYSFLIGAARALISQPLIVRYIPQGSESFRSAARSATGAAVLLGLGAGAVTVLSGILIGGATGASLAAIGVLLPGLLLQDMWRAVFIADGRPAAAFVNDVVWGVVQFGAIALILTYGQVDAPSMILGWAGAALVAALIGGFQFRGHPRLRTSVPWMVAQRDLLGYYAASFLTVLGAGQVTLLLIAALGEPADVGAIRAAQVVLGPLNLLGYSLSAFALPEIARRQLKGRAAIKVGVAISGLMVLADLVWGLALVIMPNELGEALLGDTWSTARDVILPTLLGVVAIGLGFGATMLMTALGFAKESFYLNSILAPGFLIFGLLGLHLGGAVGAALGLSIAQCIIVPLAWWRIVTLMRRSSRTPEPDPAIVS